MKIISSFKDFYDYVVGYDSDSLLSYPRQFLKVIDDKAFQDIEKSNPLLIRKHIGLPKEDLSKLEFKERYLSSFDDHIGFWIFLCFCGRLYNVFYHKKTKEYIYTFDEFVEKVDPKKEFSFTKDYGKSSGWFIMVMILLKNSILNQLKIMIL